MSTAENRVVLKDSTGASLTVNERTTLQVTATLKDETGTVITAAALTTMTLTLYVRDVAALTIINSVDDVNILNTGRGTVHATSGLVTITLFPADNQIVDTTVEVEWHRALIEWTYNGGSKAGKYEIDFPVVNLNKVT
mgnify:CR=1 FL=1